MNINIYTSNVAQLIKVQICSLSEILVLINKLSQSERNELINKRLTTDMYDLKKQFQVAIDHIIYGVSRILELPINSKKYNDDEITTILEINLLKANNLIDNLIFNVQEHNLIFYLAYMIDDNNHGKL